MTGSQPPPPGWYADPQRPGSQRWWDGAQWTDHTSLPTKPAGPMSDGDARNWAVAAHLSALAAAFVALAFLGPLVVYLVKRDEHPFVREHALEALNFNLSMLLYSIVGGIILVILLVLLVGFLLIPLVVAAAIAWLVLCIVGATKASRGEHFRYPLTIRFVS